MLKLSRMFRLFWIPKKNPYLNQATHKKYSLAKIFLPKKILKSKILNTNINPLIIPVTWNPELTPLPQILTVRSNNRQQETVSTQVDHLSVHVAVVVIEIWVSVFCTWFVSTILKRSWILVMVLMKLSLNSVKVLEEYLISWFCFFILNAVSVPQM